ncbi:MAG: germination protein YpeB [Bacillus sp. (in: firmicutes)]
MARGIIIAVLSVALIGTAYWGYQEHQAKNQLAIAAENNYQKSFHNLSYQMDLLNDKIGTTLAMNTRKSLSPALTDVWRITSEAQNEVGSLPLSFVPINKTEEFLSKIGDFTYQTAIRDLEKEPLTEEEYKTLQRLYEQSGEIQKDLRGIQTVVMNKNLKWSDVELALASGEEAADNSILDGLQTVEKKVTGYSEANQFGPTHVSHETSDQKYRHIEGKEISEQEALEIAKKFVSYEDTADMKVVENGTDTDFSFYTVTIADRKSDNFASLDLTKKVGYPIMFMNNREIGEAKITLNEAAQKAQEFLQKQHYDNMELFESAQYDSVGLFDFVAVENNIRVYTDSIKVKVALDTGSIVGYSAEDYLQYNKERTYDEPKLTLEQAKEKINPKVKIMENRLGIIENSIGDEVLCYEFVGVLNNETYRIFINGDNGEEELVEKLSESDSSLNNTI